MSVVRGVNESKKMVPTTVLNVPTALIKYLRAAVMVEVHTMYLDCGLPNRKFNAVSVSLAPFSKL